MERLLLATCAAAVPVPLPVPLPLEAEQCHTCAPSPEDPPTDLCDAGICAHALRCRCRCKYVRCDTACPDGADDCIKCDVANRPTPLPDCPEDLKLCPDGTYVGRDPWHECEFKPCFSTHPVPDCPSDICQKAKKCGCGCVAEPCCGGEEPERCPCGEDCETADGLKGVCQTDNLTCAVNVLPPDCDGGGGNCPCGHWCPLPDGSGGTGWCQRDGASCAPTSPDCGGGGEPDWCPCGEDCETDDGIKGFCQKDDRTCAVNVQPPDCATCREEGERCHLDGSGLPCCGANSCYGPGAPPPPGTAPPTMGNCWPLPPP